MKKLEKSDFPQLATKEEYLLGKKSPSLTRLKKEFFY